MQRLALLLVVACSTVLLPDRLRAHSQPYSWIDLVAEHDSLRGEVTAHIVDVAHELGLADPSVLLDSTALATHAEAIRAVMARRLILRADGEAIPCRFGGVVALSEKSCVRIAVACPPPAAASLEIVGPLFDWESTHETYVNVRVDGRLAVQDLLDHDHRLTRWNTGGKRDLGRVLARFVREGVHHIFIGPDHILFLIGLLLCGGTIRRLTRIVTAFTVAHSITLAAATLGWVHPPARAVEPLIALSIIVVGIENLLSEGKSRDLRAAFAFAFGLVHGFGFASVLGELALPADALGIALVSFNIGVELAQLAIVLCVAPLLAWVRSQRPSWSPWVVRLGSFGVIAAGGYWLVERLIAR